MNGISGSNDLGTIIHRVFCAVNREAVSILPMGPTKGPSFSERSHDNETTQEPFNQGNTCRCRACHGFAGTAFAEVTHITQGDGATVVKDGGTNQTYIVIGQGAKGFIGRGGQEEAISPSGKTEDAAGALQLGTIHMPAAAVS